MTKLYKFSCIFQALPKTRVLLNSKAHQLQGLKIRSIKMPQIYSQGKPSKMIKKTTQ